MERGRDRFIALVALAVAIALIAMLMRGRMKGYGSRDSGSAVHRIDVGRVRSAESDWRDAAKEFYPGRAEEDGQMNQLQETQGSVSGSADDQ
ncbi:MAG: hypothetical protein ACYTG7_10620 [Planctomycetota bacterium]|jgi:hypothetical protein